MRKFGIIAKSDLSFLINVSLGGQGQRGISVLGTIYESGSITKLFW